MADAIETLDKIYYDVNSPACFSGFNRVYEEAKKFGITRKQVREYLASQRTYTVHRQIQRRFPRLKTVASGLNTDWQADLAVFINDSTKNRNFRYLLVVVDVLSRKVYVEPIKTKSSANMIPAFEKIFERAGAIPWRLYTDLGLEFNAKAMQDYYEKKSILKLNAHTNPVVHASIVERMNRTIKDRLYKLFEKRNSRRWVDVIQNIASDINESVNRTTGVKPNDVTYENAEALRRKLYPSFEQNKKSKYKIGDVVRIANLKIVFKKGAENFSEGLFKIAKVLNNFNPIVYVVEDWDGNTIKGYLYEHELVKADPVTAYKIEKVFRSKLIDGEKWYLVKYKGFKNLREWIPETSLE